MVQAMSLFNQLLQHFPSLEFAALVRKHRAERAAKGFSCRAQLVAMLFCQLAHADSLREICNGLACSLGKLVHLGIDVAPNKSTLAYANKHRPAELFEDLFYTALARFREAKGLDMRKPRFRFKTNCCRWIPPPSVCVWRCFPGRNFAGPKAASRPTCCSTTTTTCRAMC